jgi:hypothetical protein
VRVRYRELGLRFAGPNTALTRLELHGRSKAPTNHQNIKVGDEDTHLSQGFKKLILSFPELPNRYPVPRNVGCPDHHIQGWLVRV